MARPGQRSRAGVVGPRSVWGATCGVLLDAERVHDTSSEFQSFVHLLDFMQPFHMLSFYIYAMLCDYHIAQPHDVIIHACFTIVSLIDGILCMVSASIRPLHCLLM